MFRTLDARDANRDETAPHPWGTQEPVEVTERLCISLSADSGMVGRYAPTEDVDVNFASWVEHDPDRDDLGLQQEQVPIFFGDLECLIQQRRPLLAHKRAQSFGHAPIESFAPCQRPLIAPRTTRGMSG